MATALVPDGGLCCSAATDYMLVGTRKPFFGTAATRFALQQLI